MFKSVRFAFLIGVVAAGSLFLAACASDDDADEDTGGTTGGGTTTATEAAGGGDSGATIDVSMTEWEVTPSAASTAAGEVVFNVTNDGTTPHALAVIKFDAEPVALTVEGGLVVTADLEVAAESDEFAAGEGGEVSADLEAGNYVLICNVAGHYDLGMHTPFTVN